MTYSNQILHGSQTLWGEILTVSTNPPPHWPKILMTQMLTRDLFANTPPQLTLLLRVLRERIHNKSIQRFFDGACNRLQTVVTGGLRRIGCGRPVWCGDCSSHARVGRKAVGSAGLLCRSIKAFILDNTFAALVRLSFTAQTSSRRSAVTAVCHCKVYISRCVAVHIDHTSRADKKYCQPTVGQHAKARQSTDILSIFRDKLTTKQHRTEHRHSALSEAQMLTSIKF